jgi:hypothetical protein
MRELASTPQRPETAGSLTHYFLSRTCIATLGDKAEETASAETFAEHARRCSIDSGDPILRATSLWVSGKVANAAGRPKEAIEYHTAAAAAVLAPRIDRTTLPRILTDRGRAQLEVNFSQAMDDLVRAHTLATTNHHYENDTLLNLAIGSICADDSETALGYLRDVSPTRFQRFNWSPLLRVISGRYLAIASASAKVSFVRDPDELVARVEAEASEAGFYDQAQKAKRCRLIGPDAVARQMRGSVP